MKVADIPVSNGKVSLSGEKGQAYVLYPTSQVPTPVDPQWGQGSNIKDPGFFAGNLDAYSTTGSVSVVKTDRAAGGPTAARSRRRRRGRFAGVIS